MDLDRETQRQTYQLCRLGFAILSAALALACLSSFVQLAIPFVGARSILLTILNSQWYHWIDAPIVWGSLIGTYLLWGRWNNVGWQRRAGLLVVMSVVDLILWFLDHGEALGLRLGEVGHEWFRSHLGQALGWAEFALMASLSGDMLAHLGVEQAPVAGKSTRSLAATGAIVWLLLFCQQTDWSKGWPLEGQRILTLETLLLELGQTMIWTITLIQVTALTIAAARQSSRVLAEMDVEDQKDELFCSPSDAFADLLPTPYDPVAEREQDRSGRCDHV
jgi:hypothetical protein